ncbi:type II toxin-antitoxin system PemK/MazF family toxin [Haloferax namakaokahaiae]|uniref:Type II toxin-antitoxin system PemK/MazF family toxin n=1 Tax=Haloferax namakaokahaiae TaxID=1748331 RepID=A0ABD5ZCH3_9EURY
MQVRRGDIVLVELNPTKGSEQQGESRPCVVVQNDTGNAASPTTIVAPFTTKYGDRTYPFEVEVLASESPLDSDSVANLSQLRVVDVSARINKNVGSVPRAKMDNIDRALRISLGLD